MIFRMLTVFIARLKRRDCGADIPEPSRRRGSLYEQYKHLNVTHIQKEHLRYLDLQAVAYIYTTRQSSKRSIALLIPERESTTLSLHFIMWKYSFFTAPLMF